MVPIIAPSARRHGIDDADIEHAVSYAIRRFDLDEGMTMLIGPSRTGLLLEVGVVVGLEALVVVHTMRAREKFLR